MTRGRGPRNDEEEGVVLTKREDLGMTRRGASRHDKKVELPHPKPVNWGARLSFKWVGAYGGPEGVQGKGVS